MSKAKIRLAVEGEEASIHESHMRSIREVCIKDHGEEEVKGWGFRPLTDRWIEAIKNEFVRVVEFDNKICGVGHLRTIRKENEEPYTYLHALYLTPEVLGFGVGKELAMLLIEESRRIGVKCMKLDSTITAYGFYKGLGFIDNGEKKKVEIGGYPVTCFPMILNL